MLAIPFLLHLFANLEISHFTELQNLTEKAGLFDILAPPGRLPESQSWRESIPEGSSKGLLKPAHLRPKQFSSLSKDQTQRPARERTHATFQRQTSFTNVNKEPPKKARPAVGLQSTFLQLSSCSAFQQAGPGTGQMCLPADPPRLGPSCAPAGHPLAPHRLRALRATSGLLRGP